MILQKLLKLIRDLKSSTFVRDASVLVIGTSISQFIPVLFSPVLTRLYSAAEFGLLSAFVSAGTMLSVLSTGRFDFAIVLPKDKGKAYSLLYLCLWLSVIFSLVMLLVLYFAADLGPVARLSRHRLHLLLPLFLLSAGMAKAFKMWFVRMKYFRFLAVFTVISTAAVTAGNLSFGFLGYTRHGMIISTLIGQTVLVLMSFLYFYRKDADKRRGGTLFHDLRKTASEFRDFPLKGLPSQILNVMSSNLPILLMTAFFSIELVGLYALSIKVLSKPTKFIGTSIAQIFFKRASDLSRHRTLLPFIRKTTIALTAIIIVPMGAVFLFGREIFEFVFGSEWGEAGRIAGIMAPFYMIRFVVSIESTLLIVHRRMGFEIIYNAMLLASQCLSIAAGFFFRDSILTFVLMSASGVLLYLWLGIYIFRISKRQVAAGHTEGSAVTGEDDA